MARTRTFLIWREVADWCVAVRIYVSAALALICLLCCCPTALGANWDSSSVVDWQYTSRNWQTADGLPHDSIYAVLQGRDGYIWMATAEGLVRFDGVRFKTFDLHNTPELKDQKIRNLFETRDGTLYICPDSGGIVAFNRGTFTAVPFAEGHQVNTVAETRDGSLWIGTAQGLERCFRGHCEWYTKANGLADDTVLSLCEENNGGLWIGTSLGLNYYKGTFVATYTETNGMTAKSIRALYCDAGNTLWIGTGGGGLLTLKDGQLTAYRKSDGIPDGFVRSIFEDSRKDLWIGTMGGLCRRRGDQFIVQRNNDGMSFETVYSINEDSEGNLWLGTKEGLNELQRKPFQSFTTQQGLAHNNVMAVYEDSRRNLWATTWGGGLSKINDGKFVSYNRSNSKLFDVLLSLCETWDGSLWVGTDFDEGLFQFKDGTFTHYGAKEGIKDPALRVLYEDRQNRLWIGSNGGLYLKEGDRFTRFTKADGLPDNLIRVIHEDKNGNLWIGTNKGLCRRTNDKFTTLTTADGLSALDVISIYEDNDGTLWLGTASAGLNRLKDGKISSYTKKQGLFSDTVSEILEDDHGNLWMSCFSGVFRVKKKDFDAIDQGTAQTVSCINYGKADGMASVQCNGVAKPSGWKGRDGRLWFPTTRGLVVVDPNSIRDHGTPPSIALEEILADKKPITTASAAPLPTEINPGRGEVELHYTALSFSAPDKLHFKYKLEGADTDWVDAGNRRAAFYNNLPPGQYSFLVKACNSEGIWNETGATAAFVLLPHYWQTTWFKALTILSAILVVSAVARYVTWKRVQEKLLRLEQQHALEKERARISRDMHDDLGASLTQIVMLSDIARSAQNTQTHLAKISTVARDLVRGFDAIVWSVNPRNDSLEKFVFYICEYLRMFLGDGPIASRVDLPDELPAVPLSSEVRHNLFLIIKEAVNNVVKHSQASEVWFRVRIEEQTLKVIIEDNGKGFSSDPSSAFSNGLENMRKRSENIGGRFCIDSFQNKGTQIAIHIPLKNASREQ